MYDPKIARFLQEDTYRGKANDPLSLNLYTYCVNNPLIYHDPTGHSPKEAMFYRSLEANSNEIRRKEIQKYEFIKNTWPTYKEDIAKGRLELRQ